MSTKNLAAFVVITISTLWGVGCTHDTEGEPEVVETEKRADESVPSTSDNDDDASNDPTKASDACPFVGGAEVQVRCECGVCAVATSCKDVCAAPQPAFRDLPLPGTADAGEL